MYYTRSVQTMYAHLCSVQCAPPSLLYIFVCNFVYHFFFIFILLLSVIIDHLHVHWTFECRIGRYIKLDFYPFRSFVRPFLNAWHYIYSAVVFFGHWNWFRISSHVLISLLLCPFATLICSIDVVPTGLQSLLPLNFAQSPERNCNLKTIQFATDCTQPSVISHPLLH